MKQFRLFLVVLTTLGTLMSLAGPASALVRVGAFQGTANVGKFIDRCSHDGTGTVSGAGLGLPGIENPKNAYYRLSTTTTVLSAPGKAGAGLTTGTLNACGRLGPVGNAVQLGAACGISKGYHGKARVTSGAFVYSLHDVTWKASSGSLFVFYASGQDGTIAKGASGRDLVLGLIMAQGGAACISKHADLGPPPVLRPKDPNNSGHGATSFTVVGVFGVINGQWRDPQDLTGENGTPVLCKDTGTLTCAYKDKKPQAPKA